MRWILLLCFALSFWLACNSNEKKEVYLLSDEQLARLFLDIQLSEVTLTGLPPAKADSLSVLYMKRMSSIYQLREDDIKAEILRLEADPEKMKMIIERAGTISDSIQ